MKRIIAFSLLAIVVIAALAWFFNHRTKIRWVSDLGPLAALTGLQSLNLTSTAGERRWQTETAKSVALMLYCWPLKQVRRDLTD